MQGKLESPTQEHAGSEKNQTHLRTTRMSGRVRGTRALLGTGLKNFVPLLVLSGEQLDSKENASRSCCTCDAMGALSGANLF